MTNVTISIGNYHQSISCHGHATGDNPLVCASISTMVTALGGYLENMETSEGESKDYSLEEGNATFSFSAAEKPNAEVKGAFLCCAIGLMQIANEFPDYVKIVDAQIN